MQRPDSDKLTLSNLTASVGSVPQIAASLQESVFPDEAYRFARRKQIRTAVLLFFLILLTLSFFAFTAYIFENGPFYYEEIIYGG